MICWSAMPVVATAQNNPAPPPTPGAQHTLDHSTGVATEGAVRGVHVTPSGLVMICWAGVPELATAQNSPSCGDHVTDRHATAFGEFWILHVLPSGLVMICCVFVVVVDTATNRRRSADQQTLFNAFTAGLVRDTHDLVQSYAPVIRRVSRVVVITLFDVPP
jgi:hypothetical protein